MQILTLLLTEEEVTIIGNPRIEELAVYIDTDIDN